MAKIKSKFVMIATLLAAGLVATIAPASAQPFGTCGDANLPNPLPLGSNCHWTCVRETVGPASKMRPAQTRLVWKKICARRPSGAAPGGKAEIHKKNVPKVRKDHTPGPND